ncbi:MAG: MFS transporter [Devosia sp.]|uniref:MFS transporter n=1 Tax=Devosia sp. TaxID=1871048 RepID=UPI001AC20311|nr:MFS transporter [Devosia sp.]MBN9307772.1 MFS transporter [Devosia sp.]MBN9317235.1 MFS transporter [Devosia sp.]
MNRTIEIGGNLPRRALVTGAFAVAVVALAYGIMLPLLPVMIGQVTPAPGSSDIAWHTSMLTGAFAIAPLIAAGPWGLLSDRFGRQPILIVGLLGFSITFGATAFPPSLLAFYALRLLNGAFAAAILPTVLAWVTDLEHDEPRRARAFALVSAASSVGLLAGPMLGGLAADLPPLPIALGSLSAWRITTFLGVAVLALGAAVAIVFTDTDGGLLASSSAHLVREKEVNRAVQVSFILLAATVAAGLGLFEVGLALQSSALAVPPSVLGFMFAGCMVIMLLVQVLAFSPWARPAVTQRFISPAFLLLGLGLILILASSDKGGLVLATAGVAAAGGFLAPVLAYWLSYGSGKRAGAHLGLESAAVSVGQTLGSTGAAVLIGSSVTGVMWLGALTIGAAAAGLALSIRLGRSGGVAMARAAARDETMTGMQ